MSDELRQAAERVKNTLPKWPKGLPVEGPFSVPAKVWGDALQCAFAVLREYDDDEVTDDWLLELGGQDGGFTISWVIEHETPIELSMLPDAHDWTPTLRQGVDPDDPNGRDDLIALPQISKRSEFLLLASALKLKLRD